MTVDISKKAFIMGEDGEEIEDDKEELKDVFIGRIPIMLKSEYCILHNLPETERTQLRECC
jgi:DNA-directed RNA polymerase II subunit RPB2